MSKVVVVEPGDLLLIGNIGLLSMNELNDAASGFGKIKETLGLAGVVLFEDDVNVGRVGGQAAVEAIANDPDLVQAFREGWEAADARGEEGNRVQAGFRAVAARLRERS